MNVNEYLKQIDIAAKDIIMVCEKAIDHQDSWPSLRDSLDRMTNNR